ncbi:MAG: LysR substrate-binding domain-containing protein [Bacteriovoracia bacterium]
MKIEVGSKAMWINYHHLYYFKIIAIEGGIARAAEKLRLGQPTLSAQLKQFEDAIGVKLFDRNHKKLILNETGKIVLEYANEIFRMGSEMVEVLHDKLPAKRIHIQIGALDSIPKHLTLSLSKAALKTGNCVVSILEGKADELLRELLSHKLDLIITNFVPALTESGLYSRRITKAPVLICGSKKYISLKKDFPRSLSGHPFVLPTFHSKLRQDLEHYFKLNNIHINTVAETQDTAIQKLLGIDGVGIVPLPLPAVEEYLKKKDLYELGRLPGVNEELFLISASRKIANPISNVLMQTFNL